MRPEDPWLLSVTFSEVSAAAKSSSEVRQQRLTETVGVMKDELQGQGSQQGVRGVHEAAVLDLMTRHLGGATALCPLNELEVVKRNANKAAKVAKIQQSENAIKNRSHTCS